LDVHQVKGPRNIIGVSCQHQHHRLCVLAGAHNSTGNFYIPFAAVQIHETLVALSVLLCPTEIEALSFQELRGGNKVEDQQYSKVESLATTPRNQKEGFNRNVNINTSSPVLVERIQPR